MCCRLAICEHMSLSSLTESQTSKSLKSPKAESCSMTRYQKHKHMHECVASGHMFLIGALWVPPAPKAHQKHNTDAAANSESEFRRMTTHPKHKHMHMLLPQARRPGDAHPYRTRSPSSARESGPQTENEKTVFPIQTFPRHCRIKIALSRKKMPYGTPGPQKQKATACSGSN
jgi:hypothetical protein